MENEIKRIEHASPMMMAADLLKVNSELDVDKLAGLLAIQKDWEANEARKAYHQAMSDFQIEAPKIIKGRAGHNCIYAGLPDIVSVIAPIESKYGLSHTWVTEPSEKGVTVTCKITHKMGHSETTSLTAALDKSGSKNDIQALGSTITYLERYTLKAALGLAETDQDDDGNAAGEKDIEIPMPNKQEQTFIDAVCDALPVKDGKVVDRDRVRLQLYAKKCRYSTNMKYVPEAVKYVIGLNEPSTYTTFEKGYDLDDNQSIIDVDENGNPL